MLFNYIKIALRNLIRQKLYSIIKIIGLAIGMTFAILLLLLARFELSYDKHNSKYDRIYMVNTHFRQGEKDNIYIGSTFPIGGALKDEYPIIEESVRIHKTGRAYFFDQKRVPIGEDMVCYADPAIFKVFDLEFIYGSPEGALDDPKSIVLSETPAKKYFGEQNPVGKTLSKNNGVDYVVKGVFKDLPYNTVRRYTGLISISSLRVEWQAQALKNPPKEDGFEDIDSRKSELFFRSTTNTFTFILLSKNADINGITTDYERFRKKYISEAGEKMNADYEPEFQHMADAFLYATMLGPLPVNLFIVYLLSSLALLILIIACINYINIATASSSARAREVGVRKVLGANMASLIRQFLCESMIIAIVSLFLALSLVELLLPSFNNLAGIKGMGISFSVFKEPAVFIGLIAVVLIVGLGAGSYPAFFLSSLQPASVIKGSLFSGTDKGRSRKVLVVTQFSIAVIIITMTMLSREAVNYIKDMDLGFNRDNIMVIIPGDPESTASLENLKKELVANTNISAVARSSNTAGYAYNLSFLRIEDKKGELVEKTMNFFAADPAFISLMGFKLLEGQSFNMGTDQTGVFLVNETLVKEMGWTGSPIGKRIQFEIGKDKKIDGKVIGVLKDFIFLPWNKMEPMVIAPSGNKEIVNEIWLNLLSIKIRPENLTDTIEFIKKKWIELNPSYPFEYSFLKDFISDEFETSDKLNQLLLHFSILGIFISCLGLFGLSSFIAESRTKEIGIRKVFGASVASIVFRLSYNFLKLVFISCIIALPIAFCAMTMWGENFPIKAEVSPWWFIISAGIALIIALATVSYHAVKAALTDPVKALRYE